MALAWRVLGLWTVTGWASPWHIAIFVLIIVLVFGSRKLPEIGRSLGTGMREFKQSITAHHEQLDQQEITGSASELPTTATETSVSDRRDRDSI